MTRFALTLLCLLSTLPALWGQQPRPGSIDTTFHHGLGHGYLEERGITGNGASHSIHAIAVQSDGKIWIGGGFYSFNGAPRIRIALLNPNGSLNEDFDPGSGANGTVHAILPLPSGKVLVGGEFITYNGTYTGSIVLLNSDGSLDLSFKSGLGANSTVRSIVLQADGRILIGGAFTSYNGITRNRIARINTDGSLDTSFNPSIGPNDQVNTVAIQSDGRILIGGWFTNFNGISRNRIARLNSSGGLDASFNPGLGASLSYDSYTCVVNKISVQSDSKIIAVGKFDSFGGSSRNGIVRLNSSGTLDPFFNVGLGANGSIESLFINKNGKILIGGKFSTFNGINKDVGA